MDNTELKTKIVSMDGFTSEEANFLYKALRLQDMINNSIEFRLHWYDARPSHNKGLSQKEIYQMWMKGKSRFEETYNYQIEYAIRKYKKKKGTYASTIMENGVIVLNSIHFKYLQLKKYGYIYLSSSLAHEAMHSQFGFKDSYPNKRNSVPYTMGNIHRKLGEMHLLSGMRLTRLKNQE